MKSRRPDIARTDLPSLGFTLVEMIVALAILLIVAALIWQAARQVYAQSSLAVSATNLRSLAAGGSQYLMENNGRFWRYIDRADDGYIWWWGFEPHGSRASGEGNRWFDPDRGPLAAYVPKRIQPDPSFALHGHAFKPKYRNGYIGIGYNVLLGGGWMWPSGRGDNATRSFGSLGDPAKVVVFATSAQVYPFSSGNNARIEEFYGLDEREVTVHFRHSGSAMVAFANGSAGFLPMWPSTRDSRLPEANIGRFAPVGSKLYLE